MTPRGHKVSPYPENSVFPWDQSHLQGVSAAPEVVKLAVEDPGCRPTVPIVLYCLSFPWDQSHLQDDSAAPGVAKLEYFLYVALLSFPKSGNLVARIVYLPSRNCFEQSLYCQSFRVTK